MGRAARNRFSDDLEAPHRIEENFDISTLPENAMMEMRDNIKTNIRFNSVVETGVPGFIPRAR